MKTIRIIAKYTEAFLDRNLLNYLEKVSKTLYPKPHLTDDDNDDDDEPILFI